jgi:hypothetical protein
VPGAGTHRHLAKLDATNPLTFFVGFIFAKGSTPVPPLKPLKITPPPVKVDFLASEFAPYPFKFCV